MQTRDSSIDALKGFSILLLVFVFMGYYFKEPALWLRILFSLEMPGFYVAAGFTLARSARLHPARYFWVRAFWLLCFAAALDALVWGKVPLLYGESLAMCALVIPLVYYFVLWSPWARAGVFTAVLLATSALHSYFGYAEIQTHQLWWWQYAEQSFAQQFAGIQWSSVWRAWLIDGWSPLFPFLAHLIFGTLIADWPWRNHPRRALAWGAGAMMVTGTAWVFFAGANLRRFGYLELSYPPVPAYVLFTCASALCFIIAMDLWREPRAKTLLEHFGRAPLACFLVANIMMRFAIYPYFPKPIRFGKIFLLGLLVIAAMLFFVFVLKRIRRRIRRRHLPAPAKILFGGVGLPKQSG